MSFFSRRDNANNGMVVVETSIPSGFKGDADKSGGNAPGLRHVEADFDRVNVYFDSVWEHCTVTSPMHATFDKFLCLWFYFLLYIYNERSTKYFLIFYVNYDGFKIF